MNQSPNDPVIDEIREARRRISERCDNDPAKLVEYYIQLQEQYRDRMLDEAKAANRSDPSAA